MLKTVSPIITHNLRNAFIGHDEYPQFTEHIFLLYRFSGDKEFLALEDKISNTPLLEMSYEPDKYHTMMVLKVPDKYIVDYSHYILSKYSMFSESYKKEVLAFHNISYTDDTRPHPIKGVLFREEWAYVKLEEKLNDDLPSSHHITVNREQEVGSVWEYDLEMYNSSMNTESILKPSKEFIIDEE